MKTFYIDIDGTICEEYGSDGEEIRPIIIRLPYKDRIEYVNQLYDEGHYIIYFTARGRKSDRGEFYYRPITEQQLGDWGCKYHELVFKPHDIDIFVDDRSTHPDQFFEEKDVSI